MEIPLERTLPQPWYIRRPRPRCRPVKAAVLFGDRDVVDGSLAPAHQSGLVEFPLFVAVGAKPGSRIIVPLILKPHRDAVAVERPEILDQAVLVLPRPFAGEEGNDGGGPLKHFRTVTPAAVLGIGQRHALRIARVPGVLGHARLLRGGLSGKRR